jgi:peptidoglycan/LPS O-acetylase OafA/YrhL
LEPVSRRTIPELDGIRGLAILAVIAFHAVASLPTNLLGLVRPWSYLPELGWCGVDIFFVLSGFLITGILFDTKGGPNASRNFYARRILRIFPLYYLTLIAYFHLLPAMGSLLTSFQHLARAQEVSYWLHLCNWTASVCTTDPPLTHLWSLAIEEQFYLIWPLLIFSLSRRSVGVLCAAIIVLAPCLRIAYTLTAAEPGLLVYRTTLCRIDTLAFGALCAWLIRDPAKLAVAIRVRPWLLWAAGGGLAVSLAIGGPSAYQAPMNTIGFTSLAVVFAYTILWTMEGGGKLHSVLRFGPIRSIGKYSYAIYIFHLPIVLLLQRWLLKYAPLSGPLAFGALLAAEAVAAAVISYICGFISWRLFESRFLRLKSHFEYENPAEAFPVVAPEPIAVARSA